MISTVETASISTSAKPDYLAYVVAALVAAHEAAAAAYAHHKETFPRAPDGVTDADCCGFAWVYIKKPSFRLREALKTLREVRNYDGSWHVSNFTRCADDQGLTGREEACKAAQAVLIKRFPEEPTFRVFSMID